MNLESIIRPFIAPDAISTRRIIIAKDEDTTDAPTTTWGAVGTLAQGVKQPADGVNFAVFCCDDTWVQQGAPITEDVHVPIRDTAGNDTGDYVVLRRVKQVKMKDSKKSGCEDSLNSISYVASYVETSLAAFDSAVTPNKSCNATYKYKWT